MDIRIHGKNIEITSDIKEYVIEKISKIDRYSDRIISIDIRLLVERNPSITANNVAEATLKTEGSVIRVKEASTDMYNTINLVADKLERSVKKYKSRLIDKTQKSNLHGIHELKTGGKKKPRIVKIKRFEFIPMTPEDAAEQLELLGHSFYVFTNSDTGKINVIYKRKDNNYGLIGPSE